MPTTTDPNTISFDGDRFHGAARSNDFNRDNRVNLALHDRLTGMTWAEVAQRHGYRSARAAEHNVGRYVAWLNGATARTTTTPGAPGMSMRRFGIEIEFTRITMAAAAAAVSAAVGYSVYTDSYHGTRDYSLWRVERDGSVTDYRGFGGEVVSPVLSGPDGIRQVIAVMQALRQAGARVDRRCGMHVHVDCGDMTGEQIGRLMVAYADRQDAFDAMVAPSRRAGRNTYCQPFSQYAKDQNKQSLELRRRAADSERYRTVNLQNLGRTGTVEFRQHQGSLNGTKATAWIKMLLSLTASVMATADEYLPASAPELLEALTAHGLDDAAARYMTGRLNATTAA